MKNWLKALFWSSGPVALVLVGVMTLIDPGLLRVLPLDSDANGMTGEFWTLAIVYLFLLSCPTWFLKKALDKGEF